MVVLGGVAVSYERGNPWKLLEVEADLAGDLADDRVLGGAQQREFFSDNLLVRIHFIIVMTRWTGLAP